MTSNGFGPYHRWYVIWLIIDMITHVSVATWWRILLQKIIRQTRKNVRLRGTFVDCLTPSHHVGVQRENTYTTLTLEFVLFIYSLLFFFYRKRNFSRVSSIKLQYPTRHDGLAKINNNNTMYKPRIFHRRPAFFSIDPPMTRNTVERSYYSCYIVGKCWKSIQ